MTSTKIFPFAPGIPWPIAYGKYIVPEISGEYWHKAVAGRDLVVACFGGLIESFFSLTYLEVLNHLVPNKKLYWDGYQKFHELLKDNSLAIPFGQLQPQNLVPFPTPIFMDRENYTFFNVLNNYIAVSAYYGEFAYYDQKALFQQLFRNCLVSWDRQYLPKIRANAPTALGEWAKINKFSFNRPYVVIFPDDTGASVHEKRFLKWSPFQVKALGAMLAQRGISLVVFTANPGRFYDRFTQVMPVKFSWIIFFLSGCCAALAQEIDYLLVSLMISDATIFSEPQQDHLQLEKNKKFIGSENEIYTKLDLVPVVVAEEIRKRL